MMFLRGRYYHCATFKDDFTRKILVYTGNNSEQSRFANAIATNNADFLAVINTKTNPMH